VRQNEAHMRKRANSLTRFDQWSRETENIKMNLIPLMMPCLPPLFLIE
jgi:hypothetical protein